MPTLVLEASTSTTNFRLGCEKTETEKNNFLNGQKREGRGLVEVSWVRGAATWL